MLVYILTQEPYHDNSSILEVHLDKEKALKRLKEIPDHSNYNSDDYTLTEWDTDKNEETDTWRMVAKQVTEFGPVEWSNKPQWRPVRAEFTFYGSE